MMAILALVDVLASGGEVPAQHFVRVGNSRVGLVYDLAAGTFDVIDPRSGRVIIRGARTELESWSSTDKDFMRTATISATTDELGTGQTLLVKCTRPDAPTLLAEFTVHGKDDSAIVLRAGLINTGVTALRVHVFRPLAGGAIAPESGWTDVRTLNGDSGCI